MKEQIQALAKEAGFVFWENEEWKPNNATIDWASNYDEELVKFAELIAYKCSLLCDNFQVEYAGNDVNKKEVAIETAHDLADIIRQYFEIE